MARIVCIGVPRGPDLENEQGALGDLPAPGTWVMGSQEPKMAWWRCPRCMGQVPFQPDTDIDMAGGIDSVTHALENKADTGRCEWDTPLQLLNYLEEWDGEKAK